MPSRTSFRSRISRLGFFTLAGMMVTLAGFAQDPIVGMRVLKGHSEIVYAVAFSPDGAFAATGSFDHTVRLWDVKSAKELRVLGGNDGHRNQVLCIAFSPNGDTLASGGSDNVVKIWDVPSRNPSATLKQAATTSQFVISPDGKTYAVGLDNGTVQLWNTTDLKAGAKLEGKPGVLTGMSFSSNSRSLTTLGADRVLHTWDLAKKELVSRFGVSLTPVIGFGLSSNDTVFVSTREGQLTILPRFQSPATKPIPPLRMEALFADFTPDGKTAAVLFADKTATILSTATGKETIALKDQPKNLSCLAISSDGRQAAGGTASGQVVLWDRDGKALGTFAGHSGAVVRVGYLPSREVISAGADGKLMIWPGTIAKDKAPMPTVIDVGKGSVTAMSLLPDGRVVVASADKSVRIFDVKQKKEVQSIAGLPSAAVECIVSRDGAFLAAASEKEVRLWTIADGKPVVTFTLPEKAVSLAFGTDRKRLIVGTANNLGVVYDLESNLPVQFVTGNGPIVGCWCDAVGRTFTTISRDKTIDSHPLPAVKAVRDPMRIGAAQCITPNGGSVLTAGTGNAVTAWNANNLNTDKTFTTDGAVTAIAVSRDNQRVAVAHGKEPTVTLFNWNDGTVIGRFPAGGAVHELAFHPKESTLIGSRADQRLVVWNIRFVNGEPLPPEFGKLMQECPHDSPLKSFAISDDGTQLLTSAGDSLARIWKYASEKPSRSLPHPNLVDSVVFEPTGKLLATGCHDGIVRLWDVSKPNNNLVKSINAHTEPQKDPIYAVAWSADGKKLATGCYNHSIKIWDAASGNLLKEIKAGKDYFPDPNDKNPPKPDPGHLDQVITVAFSPDGKYLASGSSDRTVKLWDVASGNLVRNFPNPSLKAPGPSQPVPSHPGFVQSLCFTGDGKRIVSVGSAPQNQGYLAIWNVAEGKLLHERELPLGPFYSCGVTDHEVLIGCGPKTRPLFDSEAVILPLPQ